MSGFGVTTGRAPPPGHAAEPTLWLGPLRLNLSTCHVTVSGNPLMLTRKEYAVLELLMLRRGRVLKKEALVEHLYGDMDGSRRKMIDIFVCKLRKKLAVAGLPNAIGTAWGKGYVLCDPDQQNSGTPFGAGDRLR